MKKVTNRDYKKINRLNNQITILQIKRDTLIAQFVGVGKQFNSFRDFEAAFYSKLDEKADDNMADQFEAKYAC